MTTDTFTYTCHCGGTVSVVAGQEQTHECDGFTIELTSGLVRDGKQVLVRLDRDWTAGDDRWRVYVDRANPADPYVPAQVVDGWDAAMSVAARMAKDVSEYDLALLRAGAAIRSAWPRFPDAAESAGDS